MRLKAAWNLFPTSLKQSSWPPTSSPRTTCPRNNIYEAVKGRPRQTFFKKLQSFCSGKSESQGYIADEPGGKFVERLLARSSSTTRRFVGEALRTGTASANSINKSTGDPGRSLSSRASDELRAFYLSGAGDLGIARGVGPTARLPLALAKVA